MSCRRYFQKSDGWLIAGLAALALLAYGLRSAPSSGRTLALVSVNGQAMLTLDMSRNGVYALPGNPNIAFEVRNGAAAFSRSDCPDKTCVRSGYQHRPGQVAVCLPNRLSLTVADAPEADEPDTVAN